MVIAATCPTCRTPLVDTGQRWICPNANCPGPPQLALGGQTNTSTLEQCPTCRRALLWNGGRLVCATRNCARWGQTAPNDGEAHQHEQRPSIDRDETTRTQDNTSQREQHADVGHADSAERDDETRRNSAQPRPRRDNSTTRTQDREQRRADDTAPPTPETQNAQEAPKPGVCARKQIAGAS